MELTKRIIMVGADVIWAVSLRAVHALLWLRETVHLLMVWIWEAVFYAPLLKHKGCKLECIQNDVKELRKIPMHIAVVVQEKELSYSDLANVVVWSFSAGVHTVSLYDPRGKRESSCLVLGNEVMHTYTNCMVVPLGPGPILDPLSHSRKV